MKQRRTIIAIYLTVALAPIAVGLWALGMWFWTSDPKYITDIIWAVAIFLGVQSTARTIRTFAVLDRTDADVREYRRSGTIPPSGQPSSTRQPDVGRVRDALQEIEAAREPAPSWLRPDVEDWLEMPDGPDKNKRRAELAQKLYWYSAYSDDSFDMRRTANRVRQAINPYSD